MAVAITLSRTINAGNTSPAVADTLAGGGSGIDFGNVVNGQYSGITAAGDKAANISSDAKTLFYLRSDAVVDPITEVKFYIAQYHLTYGGAASAATDYSGSNHGMVGEGLASGSSKNNADNLSSGVWMDMDWQVSTTNQFDYATRVNDVRIFGKPLAGVTGVLATANPSIGLVDQNGQDGTSISEAFFLSPNACMYWNGTTEADATTPIAGYVAGIGNPLSSSQTLGNYAKFRMRTYLRETYPDGGIIQFSTVISFSFSA